MSLSHEVSEELFIHSSAFQSFILRFATQMDLRYVYRAVENVAGVVFVHYFFGVESPLLPRLNQMEIQLSIKVGLRLPIELNVWSGKIRLWDEISLNRFLDNWVNQILHFVDALLVVGVLLINLQEQRCSLAWVDVVACFQTSEADLQSTVTTSYDSALLHLLFQLLHHQLSS